VLISAPQPLLLVGRLLGSLCRVCLLRLSHFQQKRHASGEFVSLKMLALQAAAADLMSRQFQAYLLHKNHLESSQTKAGMQVLD
jgi:hypothetical protein